MTTAGNLFAFLVTADTYAAKRGGGTISGINEIHLLAEGAIAFFTENNALIATSVALTDIDLVKQYYIAVGDASSTNGIRRSPLIDRDAFSVVKNAFMDPVYQVTTIGLDTTGSMNFPATFETGTFASIVVTDTTLGRRQPGQTKRYEVPVYASSTDASIIAALVALINAHEGAVVTAEALGAGSDEGITLTANEVGTTFVAGADGIIAQATVHAALDGTSVPSFVGFGTAKQVRELLHEGDISLGDGLRSVNYRTETGTGGFWNHTHTAIADDDEFTLWTITYKTEVRNGVVPTRNSINQSVVLIVDEADTTILANVASVLAVLHPLAGETGSGSAPIGSASSFSNVVVADGHS